MFTCAAEIAGRAAALLAAFGAALVVPLLFYSFQIYPELPAALLLLFAFRKLVLDQHPSAPGAFAAGVALSALPWLHQKYSVVAFVLGLLGLSRFVHRRVGRFALEPLKLVLFSLPLLFSAYSVFLYNHTLTGSLSPPPRSPPRREPRSLPRGWREVSSVFCWIERTGFSSSLRFTFWLSSAFRDFSTANRRLRSPSSSSRSRTSWSSRLFPIGPGR